MLDIVLILVLTAIIEIITVIFRFGFKWSAKVNYEKILKKLRIVYFPHIHHMYFGIIIAIYCYTNNYTAWFNLGIAMIISDLIHHFVVLKLVEGNSEFKFVYRL